MRKVVVTDESVNATSQVWPLVSGFHVLLPASFRFFFLIESTKNEATLPWYSESPTLKVNLFCVSVAN